MQINLWASLLVLWPIASAKDFGALALYWSILSVAWYAWERWFRSGTRHFLTHKLSETNLYTYVAELREAAPTVHFEAVCYHFETRTRTVSGTDSQGRSYTRTETYQEMVITYSGAPQHTCCASGLVAASSAACTWRYAHT